MVNMVTKKHADVEEAFIEDSDLNFRNMWWLQNMVTWKNILL